MLFYPKQLRKPCKSLENPCFSTLTSSENLIKASLFEAKGSESVKKNKLFEAKGTENLIKAKLFEAKGTENLIKPVF